ncbi:MAG: biotin--[acetyl-CoA-carboxylase] ligase [Crocinitomicaceae bacterium]|nr:biotin--[acetyl-CoA-carboxylase] ligase [Crocinitomicaceae bacterium]
MNPIGHKIIHLDSIDSTSNYVANLQKQGNLTHGTAIIADEQTEGRGQRGTVWSTVPGLNLTLSFYVEFDDLLVENQTSIHHWVALSAIRFLDKIGVKSCIKWPNDILTKNGKMAGILIENTLGGKNVKSSIIGIGLNVNQIDMQGLNATSIKLETGNNFLLLELAQMLFNELNILFEILQFKRYQTLKDDYLANLWGMHKEVRFIRNNITETGVITGINQLGSLEMKTNNGVEYFNLKEIKFIID